MRLLESIGLMIVLSLFLSSFAYADEAPPMLPASFSGYAMLDGSQAPEGKEIIAVIDGDSRGAVETDTDGSYGESDLLIVTGDSSDNGAVIHFYIDGNKASQTAIWNSGAFYGLNLTASSSGSSSSGSDKDTSSSKENNGPSSDNSVYTPIISKDIPDNSSEDDYNESSFFDFGEINIMSETPTDINFSSLESNPENYTSIDLPVYGYYKIDVLEETDFKLNFTVDRSWLSANAIDSVVLLAYARDSWKYIDTKLIYEGTDKNEYTVETSESSVFAVAGYDSGDDIGNSLAENSCIKERTLAYKSADSDECIEYPSKCDVPEGWIITDICPLVKKDSEKDIDNDSITGLMTGNVSSGTIGLGLLGAIIIVGFYIFARKRKSFS